MIYILRGHRGIGKTSLLQRLSQYFPHFECIDLDAYIEKKEGMKIPQIFSEKGEAYFRNQENQSFLEITEPFRNSSKKLILVPGAGFFAEMPKEALVIYLTRNSDSEGRIFFDRPRLNPQESPLQESLRLFEEREPQYRGQADLCIKLEEGMDFCHREEQELFSFLFGEGTFFKKQHILVYPAQREDLQRINEKPQLNQIYDFFDRLEFRSDLFTAKEFNEIYHSFPKEKLLFSLRDRASLSLVEKYQDIDWDVDLEFFDGSSQVYILSSHPSRFNKKLAENFEAKARFYKWAPKIESYDELSDLNQWQNQDSSKHCIFPIGKKVSKNAVRLQSLQSQKLHYIQNFHQEELQDQIDLMQYFRYREKKFASAVIGMPISHSQSPAIHYTEFSNERNEMLKFPVVEEELESALTYFRKTGISKIAVTSPLKAKAFAMATKKTSISSKLKSANTLFVEDGDIYCHNTDFEGFKESLKFLKLPSSGIVWGGGGTLAMLESLFPHYILYSARSGTPRDGSMEVTQSEVIIWAISNTDLQKGCKMPPASLEGLETVIDLGYKESSLAREYALKRGAKYINGKAFLIEQGRLQREFWNGSK